MMDLEKRQTRAEKAAQTVRRKGADAKREGLSEDACPYHDVRKFDGRLTFSRHWRKCWFEGYNNPEAV